MAGREKTFKKQEERLQEQLSGKTRRSSARLEALLEGVREGQVSSVQRRECPGREMQLEAKLLVFIVLL